MELLGDLNGVQQDAGGVEGEGHRERELGVHQQSVDPCLGVRTLLQASLDFADEGDGDALLEFIHRSVQVEDFDNLQSAPTH